MHGPPPRSGGRRSAAANDPPVMPRASTPPPSPHCHARSAARPALRLPHLAPNIPPARNPQSIDFQLKIRHGQNSENFFPQNLSLKRRHVVVTLECRFSPHPPPHRAGTRSLMTIGGVEGLSPFHPTMPVHSKPSFAWPSARILHDSHTHNSPARTNFPSCSSDA
jgi:hypothetical protein